VRAGRGHQRTLRGASLKRYARPRSYSISTYRFATPYIGPATSAIHRASGIFPFSETQKHKKSRPHKEPRPFSIPGAVRTIYRGTGTYLSHLAGPLFLVKNSPFASCGGPLKSVDSIVVTGLVCNLRFAIGFVS
jgi:hypothetical protein